MKFAWLILLMLFTGIVGCREAYPKLKVAYSRMELSMMITNGMAREDAIDKFGLPTIVLDAEDQVSLFYQYSHIDESVLVDGMVVAGFTVLLEQGEVVGWNQHFKQARTRTAGSRGRGTNSELDAVGLFSVGGTGEIEIYLIDGDIPVPWETLVSSNGVGTKTLRDSEANYLLKNVKLTEIEGTNGTERFYFMIGEEQVHSFEQFSSANLGRQVLFCWNDIPISAPIFEIPISTRVFSVTRGTSE